MICTKFSCSIWIIIGCETQNLIRKNWSSTITDRDPKTATYGTSQIITMVQIALVCGTNLNTALMNGYSRLASKKTCEKI